MMRRSRNYLLASVLGILLFAINLVLGKLEVAYKIDTVVHLEGVPEFMLLLVSVVLFVVSALLRERAHDDDTH